MLTTLCTNCFLDWVNHEVLTIGRPLTLCCECGKWDDRPRVVCHLFRTDPRSPKGAPTMHNAPSPDASDPGIEREIIAKGKTAPRVTPADIEAEIAAEVTFNVGKTLRDSVPDNESLNLLTICVLLLRNGFTVVGTSACASPENFDAEIGRNVARANAVQQCWPLLGFRLRDRLCAEAHADESPNPPPGSGPL